MGEAEEGQDGQLAGHRSTATGKRFSTAASGTGTPAREDSRAKKQRGASREEHRLHPSHGLLTLQKSLRFFLSLAVTGVPGLLVRSDYFAGCERATGAAETRWIGQQQPGQELAVTLAEVEDEDEVEDARMFLLCCVVVVVVVDFDVVEVAESEAALVPKGGKGNRLT
ncbi:hypothetical protein GTR04_2605 [Trichophyton interdigitale]|uniref:Uncharacterized protein n=1 Tax=Trichophyton interdigitale TaxID=101480 RepID=A0A9P5D114_9EURO|nr:hypothetical protein GY631_1764 [Trichophyton interdigitale]KAF3899733.1 hypothetical protein GY632_1164 [Trichophyton interdigitale]KAG8209989.1 hypothetical protein GTR04_2605 [Trichophyton interdigitale]